MFLAHRVGDAGPISGLLGSLRSRLVDRSTGLIYDATGWYPACPGLLEFLEKQP